MENIRSSDSLALRLRCFRAQNLVNGISTKFSMTHSPSITGWCDMVHHGHEKATTDFSFPFCPGMVFVLQAVDEMHFMCQ